MERTRVSLTAMGAALMRAAHTRLDRPALIDDPWAERLVTASERATLREAALRSLSAQGRRRLQALGAGDAVTAALARAHPSYGAVVLRARFTEDALALAVARGVRQYVVVGAGVDSFALRRPPWANGSPSWRSTTRRPSG